MTYRSVCRFMNKWMWMILIQALVVAIMMHKYPGETNLPITIAALAIADSLVAWFDILINKLRDKNTKVERVLRIEKMDGSHVDLEIVRATAIKASVGIMHLDKLNKGWRLTFSEEIEKDFSNIECFRVIRNG